MTTTSAGSYSIWSLKDIRSHDSFDGAVDNFEGYFFMLEAEVTAMQWHALWDSAIAHVGPIPPSSIINTEVQEINKNLGTFLAMRMKGRAQTLVKLAGPGNGFEALRSIVADYRPHGTTSEHSLMMTIVQPH